MKPFIDIRYDIFSDDEINKLLMGFYLDENHKKKRTYRDTTVLYLPKNDLNWLNDKYSPYIQNNVIDWAQIVKWYDGSFQNLHIDNRENYTTLSSITFLNHNFDGGETYFTEGTVVRPQKNKTLFFSGVELIHGVKKVTNGERYTIAAWYKKK